MSGHYCESTGLRHRPMYEDGKIVHIAGNPLLTTCQLCGLRLEREHLHSPWWYTMQETAKVAQ